MKRPPGGPPLPSRLEDILDGREDGWILIPVSPDATVFARATKETPPLAESVLRAVAPSLATGSPGTSLRLAPPPDDDAESPPPGPEITPAEQPALFEGSGIAGILLGLARDTGFETATLFAPRFPAWEMVSRIGPTRPWHAVLDPSTLGPTGDGVRYADAHQVPGVGPRLAALGCASVAVVAVDGGSRIVLDSSSTHAGDDWLRRALPHLAMIGAIGAEPHAATAERAARELAMVERCADATRRILEDSETTASDLLRELRQALEADEIFHLVERAGEVQVVSESGSGWPRRIPREIRDTLRSLPVYGPIDEATARQLGAVLGAVSPYLTAAFSRESRPQEALVAGWHDGLTQAVTTAVLELEAMERMIREDPRSAIEALAQSKSEIRKSLSELRALLFDLQRDSIGDSRTEEPLTKYVNDVVKRWRLPARVTVTGDLREVPKPLLGAAYVVIREGLANAAKHAGGSTVSVWVNAVPDELTVEVADTGRGFSAAATPDDGPGTHFGLGMMNRRVAEVGGTLDVQSAPGQGTKVVARLPVRGSER